MLSPYWNGDVCCLSLLNHQKSTWKWGFFNLPTTRVALHLLYFPCFPLSRCCHTSIYCWMKILHFLNTIILSLTASFPCPFIIIDCFSWRQILGWNSEMSFKIKHHLLAAQQILITSSMSSSVSCWFSDLGLFFILGYPQVFLPAFEKQSFFLLIPKRRRRGRRGRGREAEGDEDT